LTGVVINNFYPKKVFVGDTLYIECEDLSPILNENEVKIGNKKLEFINISGNTISALIANNEYPKVNNVTITVKGKTNEALDSLTILKTWSSVISYNSILSRDGSTGFTINGISYIFSFMYLSGNINEFWSFDIEKNSWKKCTNFPGGPRNYAVAFSIGSKGYVGMGDYSGFFTDFYEYNPETNIWTLKNFFPGQVRYNYFSLVIGNKSYVGFGESYDHIYNKDFWAYNPETDAWKRLSDFPGVNYETVFGFQYKNEGYISVGNHSAYKELWKYNAQEDKWVFLSIVPTQMDFAFSFILNDFGYFITKESYSIPTSWRYNIKNNTWTRIEDFKFYQGSKTIIFESNNNIYISPNSGTLIKFNAKW